jgi:hypothetical protein
MLAEDLDAYLADFGVASTLQGGAAGAVIAIYDENSIEQLGISGYAPRAIVKKTAVLDADIYKTLTRLDTGQVYIIQERDRIDDGVFVSLKLTI